MTPEKNIFGYKKSGNYIVVAKSNAQKFRLLDKVRIIDGKSYAETQFIIQAIRYNSNVGQYQYYGTDGIFAYEDELKLII